MEVSLLTALAAFNIALGLGLHSGGDEASLFEEATVLLNQAEQHGQAEVNLLLRKGLLLLAQGRATNAEYLLKMALSREPDNVAAHVAVGCCALISGDWRGALSEFQTVLRKLPSSPEIVRMAIGQCLLKMGNVKGAEMAFERVLSMNPNCVDALVALAILNLNRGGTATGMQLLKRAYDVDKNNPIILYHLANHFFFKKDLTKAMSLAQAALQNSTSFERRSEALFMMGKISHFQEKYDEAFNYYSESARLNPNLVLAQLGLGQMYLHRGDVRASADCFERVAELQKSAKIEIKDSEFWSMMGLTCLGEEKRSSQAEKLLKLAIEQGAKSFDLFIAMASLYETRDPIEASAAYKHAMMVDNQRFSTNFELMNNYAVMLHLTGHYEDALRILQQSKGEDIEGICRFNEARLLEDMGRVGDAEVIYKELAHNNPNDIAVHLRLGIICARRGQHSEATEHYKDAIGIDENNIDAWVLLASNNLRMKALTPARKAFERILKQNDRHDPFSLVALGIIYVEIARHEGKKSDCFRRALEFFIKALQLDAKNYVAANGVGVILAEMGRYKDAKDIFLQVKQAAPNFTEASLNLAHCFIELGQYGAAIHAYEGLAERLHGQRLAAMLLFLARAHYAHAKAEKDLGAFERAIKQLERAMELLPNDAPIAFNIALCQQELAATLLKTGFTGDDANRASELINTAREALGNLNKDGDSKGIDKKMLEQRLNYCTSLQKSIHIKKDTLRTTNQTRQAKLDVVRQQREQQQTEELARQQAAAEARRLEQERNEQIRKDLAAKYRSTEERVRAGESTDEDEVVASEEEEEEGSRTRRKKRSDAGKPRDRSDDASRLRDRNDDASKLRDRNDDASKPRKRLTTMTDREDEEIVTTRSSRRQKLSKDIISDSDLD